MNNPQEISALIKKIVSEKPFTISQMLSDIGLGRNAMSHMDNGSSPKVENIAKIADYLNVSVDYLLGRTEQNVDGVINNGSNNTIQNGNGNTVNSSSPLEDNEVWDTYSRLSTKDKLEVKLDIMNRGSK